MPGWWRRRQKRRNSRSKRTANADGSEPKRDWQSHCLNPGGKARAARSIHLVAIFRSRLGLFGRAGIERFNISLDGESGLSGLFRHVDGQCSITYQKWQRVIGLVIA